MRRRAAIINGLLVVVLVFLVVLAWEFWLEGVVNPGAPKKTLWDFWEEIAIAVLFGAAATAITVAVTWRGMREREDLARELARKNRLLEITVETMDQGICVFDKDMRVLLWNQGYLDIADIPKDEVYEGRPMFELVKYTFAAGIFGDAMDEEQAKNRLREFYQRGVATQEEHTLRDGRTVDVRRNPMADGGYVATFTDISKAKAAERDLRVAKEVAEAANRAKTRFLAQTSHELRTPLNAIIGFSEAVCMDEDNKFDGATVRDFAAQVRRAGRHLLDLINEVLDVSAIESDGIELDEYRMPVALLAKNTLAMIGPQAVAKRIEVSHQLLDDGCWLVCDGRRVDQMILNLLNNAVKFTPEGGTVHLRTDQLPDGRLAISVADNGIGIAEGDLARVLHPFERAGDVYVRETEGMGLGLAIVKAIMDMHGGDMRVESVKDKGTTVTLTFPAERVIGKGAKADGAAD